jgi:tetratricopeptide (TPR) repeat protein
LATLVEREVVTIREAGKLPDESEFIFRHALLREAAYAMLTDADRTLGHKLAGEWLESVGERDAMVLAEHFERGAQPARAVSWYRRAAEQALEGNDLRAAIDRAERGITCATTEPVRSRRGSAQATKRSASANGADEPVPSARPTPADAETIGSLRLLQAEAHRWRGEHAEAQKRAALAMESLPNRSTRWYSAAGELALASGRLGDADRIVPLVGDLCAETDDARVYRSRTVALARAAITLLHAGRYPEAERIMGEVTRLEGMIPRLDPGVGAVIQRVRATHAKFRAGDPGAYLIGAEGAAACFEQAGDLRNACNGRVNVGHATMELGAYSRAEQALWEALTMAKRMSLPAVMALAKHNLGLVLARQGAFEQARAMEAEAVEAFRVQGDRRLEGASRVYLALILQLSGKLEEAEREALTTLQQNGKIPGLRAHALAVLTEILLGRGETARAAEASAEAMRLLDTLGSIEEGESSIRLAHAEALAAQGNRQAASDAIRLARERLCARADRISDEELRKSFLERVPENSRTLALAAAWAAEREPVVSEHSS